MVKVENIFKSFGDVQAVNGISFDADSEGIFGLLGPNGAGKSTTIRMLMNIIAPDKGTILFDGKPLSEEDKNRIGYLPEERGLYPKYKVAEILRYFGALKKASSLLVEEKINYWLERFGLMQWKEQEINKLSKGMAQKVQFIASIVHDPELIFLDEPFSGFDPVSADLLRESIIELGKQGKTILFSTHIMEQAEKICKEIFIINKGKEVVSGDLRDIKQKYSSNTVVVEFDGDGSFIEKLPMVKKVLKYPRYYEISLSNSSPDELLKEIAGKIKITKFEVQTVSLHNVFVTLVGNTNNGSKSNTDKD